MIYAYEVEADCGTRRIVLATSAEIAARKFHRTIWCNEKNKGAEKFFNKTELVPVKVTQLSSFPVVT